MKDRPADVMGLSIIIDVLLSYSGVVCIVADSRGTNAVLCRLLRWLLVLLLVILILLRGYESYSFGVRLVVNAEDGAAVAAATYNRMVTTTTTTTSQCKSFVEAVLAIVLVSCNARGVWAGR